MGAAPVSEFFTQNRFDWELSHAATFCATALLKQVQEASEEDEIVVEEACLWSIYDLFFAMAMRNFPISRPNDWWKRFFPNHVRLGIFYKIQAEGLAAWSCGFHV